MEPSDSPIIVVHETMTVLAEEPTFAGLQQDRLETASDRVIAALRAYYDERYRNPAPADEKALFAELAEEVVLPHEELIGKLIRITHDREECTMEEEQQILRIVDDFLARLPEE